MIQISLALALIAIVFGAKLLAQHKKESLSSMYKYLAWFVIAMGFLLILCDVAQSCMRCCQMRHDKMMMRNECMMRDRGCDDPCMMGHGNMDCRMMMNHCGHGNNMSCGNDPCCKMMMNQCNGNNNCCSGGMNCHDGNMNCPDGGKGGMSPNCPMMKGGMQCKADSGKGGK
jgi:hypothetical protein